MAVSADFREAGLFELFFKDDHSIKGLRKWLAGCGGEIRNPKQFRNQKSEAVLQLVVKEELLKAIDLALAGNWEAAHETVQKYEADNDAAWIHAVLHKIEGDFGNSRYWYHRAGAMQHVKEEPRAELKKIRQKLQFTLAPDTTRTE